jgi:hypothetical protein
MPRKILLSFLVAWPLAGLCADETSFVRDHLQIIDCKFDGKFIEQTLREGLSRVAEVNPTLAQEIRNRTFSKDLKVYCDVASPDEAIYFNPEANSIHLRVTNDGSGMTNSNFFHEFLHFAWLDHDPAYEDSEKIEVLYRDPVYACHITAFPHIAQAIVSSSRKIRQFVGLAAQKCSTVSF